MAETSGRLGDELHDLEGRSATGKLVVNGPDGSTCSMYFMFGTLYHAESSTGLEGDDAVAEADTWPASNRTFDPQARLSTRETIGVEAGPSEEPWDPLQIRELQLKRLRRRALGLFVAIGVGCLLFLAFAGPQPWTR